MASWPNTRMSPEVGWASPVAQWISVDFPAPLGPSSPKNSPASMSSETPRRASVPVSYRLTSSSTASAGAPGKASGGWAMALHLCNVREVAGEAFPGLGKREQHPDFLYPVLAEDEDRLR